MRILILEDNVGRHKEFRQNNIGHLLTITETPEECIKQLATEAFDWLLLDHDLYGQHYVPPGKNTGWAVAKWLSDHPDRKPPKIGLHTLHNRGAIAMRQLLPEALDMPSAWSFALDAYPHGSFILGQPQPERCKAYADGCHYWGRLGEDHEAICWYRICKCGVVEEWEPGRGWVNPIAK